MWGCPPVRAGPPGPALRGSIYLNDRLLGNHQKLPSQRTKRQCQIASHQPFRGRQPGLHAERNKARLRMDNLPIQRFQKVPETVVRVRGPMRIVVKISARLQPEIRLNGNQAPAGTEDAFGLSQNSGAFLDGEMLQKVRSEDGSETFIGKRPRV